MNQAELPDLTLYGPAEEPSEQISLFEPPALKPGVVPRNLTELAAQVAGVNPDQLEMPFTDRYRKAAQDLQFHGASSVLADIAMQERNEKLGELRAYAEERAKQGDGVGMETAARALMQEQARLAEPPTKSEGHQALATRHLEMTGLQYAISRYESADAFNDKLDEEKDTLSLRNLTAHAQAELEGQTSWWDHIGFFFSRLIPQAHDYQVRKAIGELTGTTRYFDTEAAVNDFRQFFRGLSPDERQEVVRQLTTKSVGVFGDNPAANAELLRKLAEMTKVDANFDILFDSLSAFDIGALASLTSSLVRRGTPVRVIKEVAGEKAAGEMAAADLLQGSKIGGLNEPDLAAQGLAIGKAPWDIDPGTFAGSSAAFQERLRAGWDQLVKDLDNRLVSSGLTPEQVKEGLAANRARYSKEIDPTIHSVTFGEGSELGQKLTVLRQAKDGTPFRSKEAAEAAAKQEGWVGQAIPKAEADTTVASAPFEHLDEFQDFIAGRKGNLLISGRAVPTNMWDNLVAREGYEPMAVQLAGEWEAAWKIDKPYVPAGKILDIIAKQASDDDYRFLAEHLIRASKRTGLDLDKVRVELHWTLRDNAWGQYDLATDAVHITKSKALHTETLLHEIIHAHGSQLIAMVKGDRAHAKRIFTPQQFAAADEYVDLAGRIKKWYDREGNKILHGNGRGPENKFNQAIWNNMFVHPVELVSYGLTKREVRETLGNLKLTDLGYTNNHQSVWSAMWDIFKRVLGLKSNDTALAKLVSNYEKMTDVMTEAGRTHLTRGYKEGMYTRADVGRLLKGGSAYAKGEGSMPIAKALDKEIRKLEKQLVKAGDDQREAIIERIKAIRAAKEATPAKAAPTEEWLFREQRVDPIRSENVGKFDQQDIDSMPFIAVDPKHAASELAVEERVIGVHAEAKTRHDLSKFLESSFNKLDKKSKEKVRSVLQEGNDYSDAGGKYGKEFNYTELRAKGLSEDEAAAYFAARQVRMVSYHLRNGEMVRALKAEGMKEIEFLGTGERYAGRVLEQQEAGQALGKIIYDVGEGKPYVVSSQTIEDSYKAGKRIVRLKQPVRMENGKHYSHVLVDESSASAREITTALHYRPGEFSRIYSDQYFITVKKMAEVDGQVKEISETVRTAASPREATEFVEAHRKAIDGLFKGTISDVELEKLVGKYGPIDELKERFMKGELDGYASMDFHYTRNREEFLNGSISEAMTNGRLFTSKRSDKLFSVDRDRVNTLDVFKSLEHEVSNISRVVNISMWRENMIRKWVNTFGDMLPQRSGNDVADFFAASGARFTKGTPEAQFAERTHRYILRQIGVKNDEERMWEGLTRVLTEKMFTGNEAIESLGAKIRQKSWLGFIRNVNFNFNLGMFNPAQLLVQANGAATAFILSPLHGAKAAMTFPLLRMALMSDRPDVWRRFAQIEKLKNLGLSNEAEFVELVRAVRKTGIIDNLKSTALWNLEEGALNIFAGYPRRAVQSHTMFFNRGEEFSRLVSFDVARREWMAANPGRAWNTDEALKHIVVRMDDLTQNMTKANLARFQEGVLSIPLQFAQYNIKLAANVMTAFAKGGKGRGFTRREATQLMVGHILLYGAAGNGLYMLADEFLGTELKDQLTPEQKELIAQGAVSWALDMLAEVATGEGAKVAMGSRLGSFDYWQRLAEGIYKPEANFFEALLGPTVSSARRMGAVVDIARLWHKDPDVTGQDVLEGFANFGVEQVASLRNAAKAYLYYQHQGRMLDRQGVAMAEINRNEMLMQALGFRPTAAVDLDRLIQSKKDHNEALDDIAKQVLRVQRDWLTAMKAGDEKRAEQHMKTLQALWPDNTGDMMEVQKRVRDRLFPYETEMQKLLGDYITQGQTYNRPVIVTEQPRAK